METSTGFFDLQVNGYGGVDFNQDDLSADDLHRACERLGADGVGGILATIITESLDRMQRRLANLARLRNADPLARQIISGIHIEGPFLNENAGYRGAHPADAIRPASADAMQRLIDAANGLVRLVTLAPERDEGFKTIQMLAGQGIVIAAGHTDASLDTLRGAIDSGLSIFTHLGNGCPMQMHRHDNIIQRALHFSQKLWFTFIADGAHVPFFALKNYLRCADIGRSIIVSDAIAPAGLGPGRYTLGRWNLEIGADMVAWAPDRSHLVGAAITMKQSAQNLRSELELSQQQIKLMTEVNPRKAIGI